VFYSLFLYFRSSRTLSNNQSYADLFSSSNTLFLLPREITLKENTGFLVYLIEPDFRIFVNDILVFDPQYRMINHLPMDTFTPKNDYIIVGTDNKDYLNYLLSLPSKEDQSLFFSDVPTDLFLIDLENIGTVRFKITFNCKGSPSDIKVSLTSYNIIGSSVKGESVTLFHFPGCNEGDSAPVYYKDVFDSGRIYRISGDISSYIKGIDVTFENKPLELHYLKTPKDYEILYSDQRRLSEELNVYSLSNKTEFTSSYIGEFFNLGDALNDFLDTQGISDKLIIWSDSPFGIVHKIIN